MNMENAARIARENRTRAEEIARTTSVEGSDDSDMDYYTEIPHMGKRHKKAIMAYGVPEEYLEFMVTEDDAFIWAPEEYLAQTVGPVSAYYARVSMRSFAEHARKKHEEQLAEKNNREFMAARAARELAEMEAETQVAQVSEGEETQEDEPVGRGMAVVVDEESSVVNFVSGEVSENNGTFYVIEWVRAHVWFYALFKEINKPFLLSGMVCYY